MANHWLPQAAAALQAQRRRSVWQKLVGALAAVVVFCTTYALILPAITMERQPACGLEEHTHTEACYTAEPACGREESDIHTHNEACYQPKLTCPLPEHTHTDACYPDSTPTPSPAGEPEGSEGTGPAGEGETGEGTEEGTGTAGEQEAGGETGSTEPEATTAPGVVTAPTAAASTAAPQTTADGEPTPDEPTEETPDGGDEEADDGIEPYADTAATVALMMYPGQVYTQNIFANAARSGDEKAVTANVAPDGRAMLARGTDSNFTESLVEIDTALYTFTATGAQNTYTIHSGNIYLYNGNNTAGYPGSNKSSNIQIVENQNGEFYLYASDFSSYLYFHREDNTDSQKRFSFDRQTGSDANCLFLLYRPAKEGDTSSVEIPGYTQVTSLTEITEGQYLIVAQANGGYYLLYPSTSTQNRYTHVAKLQSAYTMTLTAKTAGTAVVTAGAETWSVTVMDSIDLKRGQTQTIQLPAGATVTANDGNVASASVDENGLVTLTGNGDGTTPVTVTVGDQTYTWNVIVDTDVAFRITCAGDARYLNVKLVDESGKILQLEGTPSGSETNPNMAWEFAQIGARVNGYNYSYAKTKDGTKITSVQANSAGGWTVTLETGNPITLLPGATVYMVYARPSNIVTSTVNHPGTVINLFDYWLEERTSPDDGTAISTQRTAGVVGEIGINQGHALKFSTGGQSYNTSTGRVNVGTANVWTGGAAPRSGIVNNTLDDDGYPKLTSGDTTLWGNLQTNQESLAYLFDPTMHQEYRAAYSNVKGLLQKDAQGYYYYRASKSAQNANDGNYAEFNEETNSFILYNESAVKYGGETGQFFPFNLYSSALVNTSAKEAKMNHYFGMTMSTRFIQQYGGHTSENGGKNTIFEFSGDDDVWIFIDGVLVADLGGRHDKATVAIDFAEGTVTINNNQNNKTTLQQAFSAAGKENEVTWNTTNTTFADGTTHTLDFFYLERGNYASNCSLTFNLTEIPVTSVYKVNQYGDPVPGATFAVYAADEEWRYKTGTDAAAEVITSLGDYTINEENGEITTGSDQKITPRFVGTTDRNGQIIFEDSQKKPYTMQQIKTQFGDHFILREIVAPPGYRLVNDETRLYIQNNVLLCDNAYQSGVWTSPVLQVQATTDLVPVNTNKAKIENFDGKTGTLFAVVMKRVGNGIITDQASWAPVYGSDMNGYTVLTAKDAADNIINRVIEAAQKQKALKDTVEFAPSANGSMQLELTSLPGSISTYYYMLPDAQKNTAQYTVAYYYTSASSVQEADAGNTYRINADGTNGGSGFIRTFGATIQVPNLNNRLYAQKKDEDGNLLAGATFAMYKVEEENGTIYYLVEVVTINETTGEPETKTIKVPTQSASYTYTKPDPETGVFTATVNSTTYTISPAKGADGTPLVSTTSSSSTAGECAADFDRLMEGQYYLREIKTPGENYLLNETEVKVLVTEDGLYANAGTEEDGVTVARGPGYVVKTLHQFASDGQIDKTLTWVYEKLRVKTGEVANSTFDWLGTGTQAEIEQIPYLKNGNGDAVAYLKYSLSEDKLFNYTLNTTRDSDLKVTSGGVNTRRLYTDEGWGYLEIYQDSAYKAVAKTAGANYEEIVDEEGKEIDIATLFSRSVFVQVTDEFKTTDLTIKKVDSQLDSDGKQKTLSGAQFTLTCERNGKKLYYNGQHAWQEETATLTTDANGAISVSSLRPGTYTLTEVRAPSGYAALAEPIVFTLNWEEASKLQVAHPNPATATVSQDPSGNGFTLTIPNTATYELPATGGEGTAAYTIAGAVLVLGAGLLMLRNARKREGAKGSA